MSEKQNKRFRRQARKMLNGHLNLFTTKLAAELKAQPFWMRVKIAWRIIFNGSL